MVAEVAATTAATMAAIAAARAAATAAAIDFYSLLQCAIVVCTVL